MISISQLILLARKFMQDYGARFDMDIPSDVFLENVTKDPKEHTMLGTPYVHVRPKGQFSSIISSLEVRFTFRADPFDRVFVEVHSSYDHVDGGSNGYRMQFVMVIKKAWEFKKEDSFLYKGFITYDQYVNLISHHNDVLATMEKEREKKKGSDEAGQH